MGEGEGGGREEERGAANDGPAFTLSRGQLAELVSKAVQVALAKGSGAPLLVDKQEMARQLSCSAAHVDNLRKRGLPVVKVGEGVRFAPAQVLAWLQKQ